MKDMSYKTKYQNYDLKEANNDNIVGVTEEEMENGKEEFYVDFRNKKTGKFIIKVRNLIERDQVIRDRVKKLDEQHLNILHIFVDVLSRNHFQRRYHKTGQFFRNYHYSKKRDKKVYEFFRFHSLIGYTFPNLLASVYGVDQGYGWSATNLKSVEHYAQDAGYITAITSDLCVHGEYFTKSKQI